jgi:large subunit ribosomal protein L24
MKKIRKGDNVIVISGRDKGRRGTVLQVLADDFVVVEGLNQVKRHTKANPNKNQPGGIIAKDAPLHLSKVALFNPGSKKGDRVRISKLADGKKVRVFKSNGENVDA